MQKQRDLVLFLDGTRAMCWIHRYDGACLTGQATAYTMRHGHVVWLVPGVSVRWVEQLAAHHYVN